MPNFIEAIVGKADARFAQVLRAGLYNEVEQCARVLARALGRDFPRQVISDDALNTEYEKALSTWCPEHPFLDDRKVRNAVFEAVAVTRCALCDIPEYQALAFDYASSNRPTYHLLFIMAQTAANTDISNRFFNMLIQSCSDFVGKGHEITIEVNGLSWDEPDLPTTSPVELEVIVSIPDTEHERTFKFKGSVSGTDVVPLGPFLANATITLPCEVDLKGLPAIDCLGTCKITARKVRIDTPDLVVRGIANAKESAESGLFLDVDQVQGHATSATIKGGKIEIGCIEHGLAYPLAKYVERTARELADPDITAKFRRLRRILSEFASHSKGGLAKYRAKIEHERVLRGKMGRSKC